MLWDLKPKMKRSKHVALCLDSVGFLLRAVIEPQTDRSPALVQSTAMKSLIILRHAKSDHPLGVNDFDRDLTERGLRDALRVGEILREQQLLPESIVTSAAQRARTTTERVVTGSAFEGSVEVTPDFYEAGTAQILNAVRAIQEGVSSAMIVGHNPGFWGVACRFDRSITSFPTAAWVRLELDIEYWGELTEITSARRTHFWYPKLER